MKKVRHILSSVCQKVAAQKNSALIFVSVTLITSLISATCFSPDIALAKTVDIEGGQKMILELSESLVSKNSIIENSTIELSSDLDANAQIPSLTDEILTGSESEAKGEQEVKTQAETLSEEKETTQANSSVSASGNDEIGYTFSELGLTQISEIPVPDDIKFDKNGIPLNYAKKLSGKSTTYIMGHTTATGTSVHPGVIAVNPEIIPYGTTMYIVANDGSGAIYGYSCAEDTGGFIYMQNGPIVDMYVNSLDDVYAWGNHPVDIYIF